MIRALAELVVAVASIVALLVIIALIDVVFGQAWTRDAGDDE